MLKLGLIWNGTRAEDVLREFLDDLRSKGVDLRTVIVIGSRARGTWKTSSDIDLVVIVRSERDLKNVILGRNVGIIDPKPYTISEAKEALKNFDTTIIEALEYGLIVYDSGFWKHIAKEYKEKWKDKVKIVYDEKGDIAQIYLTN